MKRTLSLLLAFVLMITFFASCDAKKLGDNRHQKTILDVQTINKPGMTKDAILFWSKGDWWNDRFINPSLIYTEDVVPDAETAVALAQIVFAKMKKLGNEGKYEVRSIKYDEEDEVWIVYFYEDPFLENDMLRLGGPEISIAIQKTDGKVLRIWRSGG